MDRNALFLDNLAWSEAIGRAVHRKLPPSFDVDDLIQEARIEHWKRCELYDPEKNSSYQGYAYQWIVNAVRMKTRRGAFREATHEPLPVVALDPAENAAGWVRFAGELEAELESVAARRQQVEAKMEQLSPVEQYLVKRVHLDGEDAGDLAKVFNLPVASISRKAAAGVRRLKRG